MHHSAAAILLAATLVVAAAFVSTSNAYALCGDGVVETPEEDCDDGNAVSGDGCNYRCRTEPGYICPGPGTPVDTYPVGWWRFGENVDVHVADRVGTNDGTYTHWDGPACASATECPADETCTDTNADGTVDTCIGGTGPTLGAAGISGDGNTAASFDGWDDIAVIPHSSAYYVDQGAVSLWFNATSMDMGNAAIFSKDHGGLGEGGHLNFYVNQWGTIRVRLQETGTGLPDGAECTTAADCVGEFCDDADTDGINECRGANNNVTTGAGFFTTGTWYHVVATFGPGGLQLYVNGVLQDSHTHTGGLATTSGGTGNVEPIVVGANSNGSAQGSAYPLKGRFPGTIDELMFFDRQLGADEIALLYNVGGPYAGGACAAGTPSTCGNGLVQAGEGCDDGNNTDGDGCSGACIVEYCGDGVVNNSGTETCDDGNTASEDGCSSTCTVETGYTCDNMVSPSSCTKAVVCGDGTQEPPEECDDNNTLDNDGCSADCIIEFCGDGLVNNGETCDDYNTTAGDGCDANCQIEPGYTCTEADDATYGKLPSVCVTTCGDGTTAGAETCDDGNTDDNDGCSRFCEIETCGDTVVQTGEECDDGNMTQGDGCHNCLNENPLDWACDNGGCIPRTTCDPTISTKIDTGGGNGWKSCPGGCTTPIIGAYNMSAFDLTTTDKWAFDDYYSGRTYTGTVELGKPVACTSGFCGGPPADTSCSTSADCPTGSSCYDSNGDTIVDTCSTNCTYDRDCPLDSNGWTKVVDGTSNYPSGGDYYTWDVEFDVLAPYTHSGGWIFVRMVIEGGALIEDYGSSTRRMFYDGTWPYSIRDSNEATAWQIRTGPKPCAQFNWDYLLGGNCDSTTSECVAPYEYDDCSRTDARCGDGTDTSCQNCTLNDYFYWNPYNCCSGGEACKCLRLYERKYSCYVYGSSYPGRAYCRPSRSLKSSETSDCAACGDGDACTNDYCSAGTCRNTEVSGTSCYYGPSAHQSVGICNTGTEYCRSPGVCSGDVFAVGETCDAIDNDCDNTVDDSPDADPSCDDGDPNTDDYCNGSGTCVHDEICAQTATSCDLGLTCVDCTANDGWYATSAVYDCCSSGSSCDCTDEEHRVYTCDTANPGAGCVYTVDDNRVTKVNCTVCDDGNVCTTNTCDPDTGLCAFPDDDTYCEPCYTGPAGTEGVGICEGDTWCCSGGSFGACNDTTPTAETCDGFDEDCNGIVDDGTADDDPKCAGNEACWSGNCDDPCDSDMDCGGGEICYKENGETTGRCAPDTNPCDDLDCTATGQTCYEGSCTNDDCTLDPTICEPYAECYQSGRCLNDDTNRCDGVMCPTGFDCVKGTCVEGPCTVDGDCGAGEECVQGYCFPETDSCAGVDCQVDERCWEGSCYQDCGTTADCTDEPGDVCYDAFRCAPETDPCFDIECASDEFCYEGSCYLDCSLAACSDPSQCYTDPSFQERCAVDNCDGVQCPEGQACQGGVCYVTCTDDLVCQEISTSHYCWGGYCKTGACDGVQCAADEICSGGVCYPTCMVDADCSTYGPNHVCYDGTYCSDDPCAGFLCPEGESCWQGSCFPDCTSTDPVCDDTSHACYDEFRCGDETDPCFDVKCGTEEVCYQGSCYEDCSGDLVCSDPNHVCWDSLYCAPPDDPCSGVQCPEGELCYSGSCFPECPCTLGGDMCYDASRCAQTECEDVLCPVGWSCFEGTCYEDCAGTIDCTDPSHICFEDRCVDPCEAAACLPEPDETCYLGTCYEYCDEDAMIYCTDPDHVCYDNRCVDGDDPWCDGIDCPDGEECYRSSCYDVCNSQDDCDMLAVDSVCYQDKCIPTDCGGEYCDAGEICYNGICYEDCSGDLECDDPTHICYDDTRCAASACEAQAQSYIDDYHAGHVFTQTGRMLIASQQAKPITWPRPYTDPGTDFKDWIDVPDGDGVSSNNDALYSEGAARLAIFHDDNDNKYTLWFIQGSKSATQGASEATYSIRVKSTNPEVVYMDDKDGEAYYESPQQMAWTHVQAHVTAGPSETGGIAIGKFPAPAGNWKLEIHANFGGDIDRWEIMNGETGEPQIELSTNEPLILKTGDFPHNATDPVHAEFGTVCTTEEPGICEAGHIMQCKNWQLICEQDVYGWNFEICDGVDNTCNGLTDVLDPSLQFPSVSMREDYPGVFGTTWRPWPTIDEDTDVNAWMNYTPRNPDDRTGSTNPVAYDGTPLQNPRTIYVAMHRQMPTGELSMPILVGAETTDEDTIDDLDDQDEVRMQLNQDGDTTLSDVYACWYDDRQNGSTSDVVFDSFGGQNAEWEWDIDQNDDWLESDAIVIRPVWLEAYTGDPIEYNVYHKFDDDDDFERRWRRYAPVVDDLPLDKYKRYRVKVEATDPDESYCISDSMTANGCVVGTYLCTAGGIECSDPDDDNCTAGCQDFDGDGHILKDPVFCTTGTDCDDYDADTFPGATELCDGRDNDCDGVVDYKTTPGCEEGTECGPSDCNERPICVCPEGPEFPGDDEDLCFCQEALSP